MYILSSYRELLNNMTPRTAWDFVNFNMDYLGTFCAIKVLTSISAKFFVYFNNRTYFLYFTQPLFKTTNIILFILHYISLKYYLFIIFFITFPNHISLSSLNKFSSKQHQNKTHTFYYQSQQTHKVLKYQIPKPNQIYSTHAFVQFR